MARPVVWTDPAVEDLEAGVEFIAQDSLAYARSLAQLAVDAAESLAEFPNRGHRLRDPADVPISRAHHRFLSPHLRRRARACAHLGYLARASGASSSPELTGPRVQLAEAGDGRLDSIRELAEFWDTHEVAAFEDQLEEVTETVFARPKQGVTIPLSGDERAAIRRIAAARGVDEEALLREWVQEKLHH